MLIDIILLIITAFIMLVRGLFAIINIAVPQEAIDAITYFVGQMGYLTGFLNISDILQAVGWFLTFTTGWYTIKLMIWGFGLIPWFGKSVSAKL